MPLALRLMRRLRTMATTSEHYHQNKPITNERLALVFATFMRPRGMDYSET